MSGNGDFFAHNGSLAGAGKIFLPSGAGGGCVTNGPFKKYVIFFPHCLQLTNMTQHVSKPRPHLPHPSRNHQIVQHIRLQPALPKTRHRYTRLLNLAHDPLYHIPHHKLLLHPLFPKHNARRLRRWLPWRTRSGPFHDERRSGRRSIRESWRSGFLAASRNDRSHVVDLAAEKFAGQLERGGGNEDDFQ